MNPKVSIVIPVYNGENYMREAIDSALSQNYSNIEVIVVNDGSTDSTRDIAKSYGDRIRYFEKENGGVSTALNMAIKHMQGEYFSWLSHDDIYYPDKIQIEIDALYKSGNMKQAVDGNYDALIMPEGHIIHPGTFLPHFLEEKYLESGLLSVLLGYVEGCSLLIPKEYFDKYGCFDVSLRGVQDYQMWFRMLRNKRVLYIDKPLYVARLHSEQVTRTYNKLHTEEDDMYLWMLKSVNKSDIITTGLSEYQFWGIIVSKMLHGKHRDAGVFSFNKLNSIEQPTDALELCNSFKCFLELNYESGIFLYGAGKRGVALLFSLLIRGVNVNGLADLNESKIGKTYMNVKCIPIDMIPKNSLLIISIINPAETYYKLYNQGYNNLMIYDQLWNWLLRTPVKKELLNKYREFYLEYIGF